MKYVHAIAAIVAIQTIGILFIPEDRVPSYYYGCIFGTMSLLASMLILGGE